MTSLEQMLQDAYRQGSDQARYAALDAVFRHADAAGETAFGFRARMNAISEFHHHGEYARSFMAFHWCLTTFDRQPEVTSRHDEHSLLWRFKWIVWQMPQFSAVPLDRAIGLLDDMERRYRAGNHSLHAVYQYRGAVAAHLGDLDAAGRWFGEMLTARRDGLSDCAACVPTSHVEYLTVLGEFEEAVRVGSPYASGGCTEQPQQMLSQLLLPYLRTGRTAEAVAAHRKAYALIRANRHYLELIGLHLQFCALTGNQEHGLPILERHLPWLDRPASTFAALEFASAGALLLRGLIDAGHGDVPVRRRTDNGDRRWTSTAAETYDELAARARSLAAEFDRRNGNTYQSGRIEQRLSAEPIVAKLPLTVLSGRPIAAKAAVGDLVGEVAARTAAGDAAGAARLRLEVAYALRNAGQWDDATETAEEAQRSLALAGLTAESSVARFLLVELYGRSWQQRDTAYAMITDLLAEPDLPAGLPSRAGLLERAAALTHDGPRAFEHLLAAAALHRDAGDAAGEARALLGSLRRVQQVPQDWARLVARLDELIAAGALRDGELVDAQHRLCWLETRAGRPEAALERARAWGDQPRLRLIEAGLLQRLDRHVEAEEVARRLATEPETRDSAALLVARSLLARDRRPEAEAWLAGFGLELDDLDYYDDDLDDLDDED
ncbi:hypothetical protein [Actinoplanes regularis]|uniref:hypothetical protein n=1 Tax=Actinoplanes regularis TaxID=52697 RepID=UPI0024A4FD9B|nr:hypothetical protein [Actinoplanes regularis]GLW31049.1 hypothetical protein Areg01_39890 [Actinoplanes regularis]